MENLTWKDIEIKTQGAKAQFFIHVTKGKTTKYTGARKVVCKRDVIGALIRLRDVSHCVRQTKSSFYWPMVKPHHS